MSGRVSGGTGRRRSRAIRLRRWLLAAAIVFTGMIVAFLGVAHYRARKAILALPRQLGIDIKTETNGFTISRSFQGHTQVVLHAAKAIQHQNGKTTLHDVAITLYGAPGSNRVDSIRGGEFDYDQSNGVLRAMGDTVLDVAAPMESTGSAKPNAKRLTVHAKGLVVLEKLGVASTKEQLRFQYGATQGEAMGADYERDTGVIRLFHDVHLHSEENGHVEQIDAASAELHQEERTAVLHTAMLRDAVDTLTAPLVRAELRKTGEEHAGTLQEVHASGGVSVRTSTGEQIDAPELTAAISDQNRIHELQMRGGVRMRGPEVNATANHAVLSFAEGRARHVVLDGTAHLEQPEGAQEKRTLEAARMEADLEGGTAKPLAFRDLTATGNASLLFTQVGSAGRIQRTQLSGPVLVAHSAAGSRNAQISDLQAPHGARLQEEDGTGAQRTSTSDRLTAHFSPDPHEPGRSTLQSVAQEGNVDIRDTRPAVPSTPGKQAHEASHTQARGQRAEFQASTNLLTLTGAPQVSSDGLQLAAARIVVNRETGDADASGEVRGSVAQNTGTASTRLAAEPTKFAASTAHLSRNSGSVVLMGGTTSARLWTATGQVEAPVIEADQRANTLHAHAAHDVAGAASAAPVRTVLAQAPSTAPSNSASAAQAQVIRIFSRDLVYTAAGNGRGGGTATFRGGVRLLQGEGTITADSATAALGGASMLSGNGVQSVTAAGRVHLVQNDRTASGDKLVYTAADRRAVLTGTPGAPPSARDAVQGVVTGTELVLRLGQHAGDNSVEITGAENTPVRTELDMPESNSKPPRSRSRKKPGPTP